MTGLYNSITWNDYFMAVALLSAQRSKDVCTQVGACIVNSRNKIVGIGYNGFPIGCIDNVLPWGKNGFFLDTKYAYVCHAELNAIVNSEKKTLRNCSIYTVLFPCNECSKIIIQSGISKIIYLSDKYFYTNSVIVSKRMLDLSGVKYKRLVPNKEKICIYMDY